MGHLIRPPYPTRLSEVCLPRRVSIRRSPLVHSLPRGQRKSILRRFDQRLVLLSSSAVPYREVKMFAIATAALLVFSVSAQAAKYDYGRDAYSEEPSYTYKQTTMYRPTYKQSHEYRYRREVREGQQGECIKVCDTISLEELGQEHCEGVVHCTKREGNIFYSSGSSAVPFLQGP